MTQPTTEKRELTCPCCDNMDYGGPCTCYCACRDCCDAPRSKGWTRRPMPTTPKFGPRCWVRQPSSRSWVYKVGPWVVGSYGWNIARRQGGDGADDWKAYMALPGLEIPSRVFASDGDARDWVMEQVEHWFAKATGGE